MIADRGVVVQTGEIVIETARRTTERGNIRRIITRDFSRHEECPSSNTGCRITLKLGRKLRERACGGGGGGG